MRKLGRILWRHLACVQGLAGAPAVLADVPPAVMLTDSRAPAVLALAAFAVMLTDARARAPWQMLAPPQSSGLQTSCRRSAVVMPVLTRTRTYTRAPGPRAGASLHCGCQIPPRNRRLGFQVETRVRRRKRCHTWIHCRPRSIRRSCRCCFQKQTRPAKQPGCTVCWTPGPHMKRAVSCRRLRSSSPVKCPR